MSVEINDYRHGTEENNGDFYNISKYIPLMTFVSMYHINTELELVSLVLQKPDFVYTGYFYGNSSPKILSTLSTSVNLKVIKTNGLVIYIGKGIMYDDKGNILLCLSIETQPIIDALIDDSFNWSSFFEGDRNFIGYAPFVMFVSTEFANDKKFAVLHRRIKKIYLDFCFEKGIEMRLVSSSRIEKNTFTNNLKIKFNSLTELNHHLTEDVKHLLRTPLYSFQETEFPLLLGLPPIPKSKEESSVEKGVRIRQEVEKLIYQRSGDSMLEDSDRGNIDYSIPVVLDVSSLPIDFDRERLMQEFSRQSVSFSERISIPPSYFGQDFGPVENNNISPSDVDRIMAIGMSLLNENTTSNRYVRSNGDISENSTDFTHPITYNPDEGLSRDSLEEAINYLASEADIQEMLRQEEAVLNIGEDTISWEDVDIDEQEDEQERDLPY